jgi:hypothetical protein
MNPETFATLLSTWLCRQAGQLPQALALDGKMIRDQIGRLALAQHEDGAPQAVAVYDAKDGTARCEPTVATALLESLPSLDGKRITADPLPCQRKRAQTIVPKGGDYLFQVKANQPHRFQIAQTLDALPDAPFLSTPREGTDASKPDSCILSPLNPCAPISPLPAP